VDGYVDNEPRYGMRVPRDIVLWRRSLLHQAGFAPEVARHVAADPAYDLHGLLNLVDRGCPPQLAAHILAPL
jgi:hypothetical protein